MATKRPPRSILAKLRKNKIKLRFVEIGALLREIYMEKQKSKMAAKCSPTSIWVKLGKKIKICFVKIGSLLREILRKT